MALLTLLFPSHLLLPLLFSYLPSTVLSSTSLISPSISSLFTAYSVCGLPTLTALQSFIKQLINSTRTHLHTDAHTHVHMHAGMCEIFIGGGGFIQRVFQDRARTGILVQVYDARSASICVSWLRICQRERV